jgi:hypothetical protein
MTFFPEIPIDEPQAKMIARGLMAIARAEKGVDPRELAIIRDFYPGDPEALTNPLGTELAAAFGKGELPRLFLKSALLVAFVDGEYGAQERALVDSWGAELGIPAEEIASLEQSVKEFLLASLARLSNVEAVAEVAKKLQV